ncbi:hypothetical protein SAMN05216604_10827 [Pseudomonas agarici]|nr:hypothetical protein SAMN05216604_10827 [Pseudomonas agarici]
MTMDLSSLFTARNRRLFKLTMTLKEGQELLPGFFSGVFHLLVTIPVRSKPAPQMCLPMASRTRLCNRIKGNSP